MLYNTNYSEEYLMTYAVVDGKVIILAYEGQAASVEIPTEIDGMPVTMIENYAFSGKSMRFLILPSTITEICHHAFSECKDLKNIDLPDSIRKIGNYAFYNCWNVEKVHLPGHIASIGFGAFKNCEKLTEIEQDYISGHDISIGSLLDDLNQQIHVTMRHIKEDGSAEIAKVIFTEHDYDAGSFTAAWNKQYEFSAIGSGKYMRYCISSKDIDYKKYDSMFYVLLRGDSFDTIVTVAVERLMFPYMLTGEAREQYLDYLKANAFSAGEKFIKDNEIEKLRFLTVNGLLDLDAADHLIDLVSRDNKTELTALLMDYRHKKFSFSEMSFDL